jgi:hypothetical protein
MAYSKGDLPPGLLKSACLGYSTILAVVGNIESYLESRFENMFTMEGKGTILGENVVREIYAYLAPPLKKEEASSSVNGLDLYTSSPTSSTTFKATCTFIIRAASPC